MKTRFTIDLKVFHLMLKEIRSLKREIRALAKNNAAAAASITHPKRDVKDKIYSSDVMRRLRITAATLIKYEKQGLIKFHKEGRDKVYSEAEILQFRKFRKGHKRLSRKFLTEQKKKTS